MVDAEGKPLVMYHGTLADFSEFDGKGLYFVTPSAEFSEKFTKSEDGGFAEGAKVMPVYVKASNPFDYENKKHVDIVSRRAYLQPHAVKEVRQGKWQRIEDRTIIAAIKKSGFDGIYVNEEGVKNLAVFDPSQIKSATGNSGQFDPANPDIRYSRSVKPVTNPAAVKMRHAMVQRTVDALAKGWAKAPNVTVVDSMQDERVPEAVRQADAAQRSQGAMGEPEGFWYRGQVYLVASALPTSADAARVLYHEVLGHHGLRGHFGKDLDRVLDQVIKLRRKDVQAKAQEYGLDMSNPEHAGYAAEEVLAELAQSRPDLGFVQRAIAAIRNFLRTHVPGFKVLELTDADIVQGYLLPARGWVERGGVSSAVNGDTRFESPRLS